MPTNAIRFWCLALALGAPVAVTAQDFETEIAPLWSNRTDSPDLLVSWVPTDSPDEGVRTRIQVRWPATVSTPEKISTLIDRRTQINPAYGPFIRIHSRDISVSLCGTARGPQHCSCAYSVDSTKREVTNLGCFNGPSDFGTSLGLRLKTGSREPWRELRDWYQSLEGTDRLKANGIVVTAVARAADELSERDTRQALDLLRRFVHSDLPEATGGIGVCFRDDCSKDGRFRIPDDPASIAATAQIAVTMKRVGHGDVSTVVRRLVADPHFAKHADSLRRVLE